MPALYEVNFEIMISTLSDTQNAEFQAGIGIVVFPILTVTVVSGQSLL